jgi:hypothetical protein
MKPRSLKVTLLLMLATAAAGLAGRFAHLGLPPFFVKYIGSAMWAMMIYWVVSTLLPRFPVARVFLLAGVVATAGEFVKLCHAPWLEAFRGTLAGVILLGRIFSPWDIAAYWLAIAAGAAADAWMRDAFSLHEGTLSVRS